MKPKILIILSTLVLCLDTRAQTAPTPSYNHGPVTPYSDASKPSTDVVGLRRGERYNVPYGSLPELGENSEPMLLDLPETHFERARLPIQQSDAVVVATVQSGQSFLSNDKRNIYSEYHATVDEVLKAVAPYLRAGDSIDIERGGGAVKLPSGKTLIRGKLADSMPVVGERYLLFLKYNADTEDYHIQTAFQLYGDKVYRLDDRNYSESSHEIQHALQIETANANEFLTQIRAKVKIGVNQ